MCGWRCFTILMQSAQLAQWAASLPLTAFSKPMPPNWNGNDANVWDNSNGSTDISCTMHCQTLASWCSANERVKSGLTVRNQKFARVAPHISKSNHPDWRSSTAGIRVKRMSCSEDFLTKKSSTYSGRPMGVPSTRTATVHPLSKPRHLV